jgi:hypothetical protein
MRKILYGIAGLILLSTLAPAAEPEWSAAAIKECDRACLVSIMDGYMDALSSTTAKPSLRSPSMSA